MSMRKNANGQGLFITVTYCLLHGKCELIRVQSLPDWKYFFLFPCVTLVLFLQHLILYHSTPCFPLCMLCSIFLLFSISFLDILLLILNHSLHRLLPLSLSALIFSPSSFSVSSCPLPLQSSASHTFVTPSSFSPLHLFWPLKRPGRAEEITPILPRTIPALGEWTSPNMALYGITKLLEEGGRTDREKRLGRERLSHICQLCTYPIRLDWIYMIVVSFVSLHSLSTKSVEM